MSRWRLSLEQEGNQGFGHLLRWRRCRLEMEDGEEGVLEGEDFTLETCFSLLNNL